MQDNSPLKYLADSLNSKLWGGVAEAYLIELARRPAVLAAIHNIVLQGLKDEKIRMAHVMAASGDKVSLLKLEALSKDGDAAVAQEGIRALRVLKARLP